jgi:hypothetical protein
MTMAGAMKASQGKDKLSGDPKMAWVEDFSDGAVRGSGVLEVAGAAGLILPWPSTSHPSSRRSQPSASPC